MFALMIAVNERRSADSQNRFQNRQLLLYQSHFANHYKYMKALTSVKAQFPKNSPVI